MSATMTTVAIPIKSLTKDLRYMRLPVKLQIPK